MLSRSKLKLQRIVISSMYIMRTLVDIPEESLKALNGLAKSEKVSRSELVRQAIADFVSRRAPKRISGIEASFGVWKDMEEDGLAYQVRLRDEWER